MNTVKTVALGVFVVLIGAQCFGAAVNQDQAKLNEEFIRSMMNNRDGKIDDYLSRGAEIDCVDALGNTPLMTAILFNYANVTQKLLDRRANVNAQNNDGGTALIRAARNANFELVRVLLEQGALVDVQDRSGETALMKVAQAFRIFHITTEKFFNTMRVLVEDGRADLSLTNNQGVTALNIARQTPNRDERIFALLTMGG